MDTQPRRRALRSSRVIGTARAILSCFTFLFTPFAGGQLGRIRGRKNSSSLPPVPATYSLDFPRLVTGTAVDDQEDRPVEVVQQILQEPGEPVRIHASLVSLEAALAAGADRRDHLHHVAEGLLPFP